MIVPLVQVKPAGDAALIIELERRIAPEVNARAIRMTRALQEARIHGVRDVVPTYRSVGVYFDPLVTDTSVIERVVTAVSQEAPETAGELRTVDITVEYGGDVGPDLDGVAAAAGMTPEDVIARHSGRTYRVYMLGFLPGFAYLGTVDPAIAAPRHATPRLRVPAGSVGIAGGQTGIYPRDSAGGWNLIGRADVSLFDPSRVPASLLAPGDHVRFVPRGGGPAAAAATPPGVQAQRAAARIGARGVTVVAPGLFTTVQDLGRWGHQSCGVSVSGPMDSVAHRLANAMVGNPSGAATLEATIVGPELRMEGDAWLALAGADLSPTLDGVPVPSGAAVPARKGSVLRFGTRRSGTRAYIAFDGGVDTEPVLGSRSTHVLSGLGGLRGRSLRAGDTVSLGASGTLPRRRFSALARPVRGGVRLRVVGGPQDDHFPASTLEQLQSVRFVLTAQSDRMGYRLAGAARLERIAGPEMISDVALMGGVQVPASGEPILLMADRQTTGGYPQVATVIGADLPLAGQLAPGDWVEFRLCSLQEARTALDEQETWLRAQV